MLAITVLQPPPLFVEYSILTLVIDVADHVMFWFVPMVNVFPPLGLRTVTLGGGAIVNVALLVSPIDVLLASLIRINACDVGKSATVHENVPAEAGVLVTIVFQPVPPFVEY